MTEWISSLVVRVGLVAVGVGRGWCGGCGGGGWFCCWCCWLFVCFRCVSDNPPIVSIGRDKR